MNQSIKPGEGIDILKLNTNLHTILSQFKRDNLSLFYSSKDYLNTPIKVDIKNLGISLMFQNDKLSLIEIHSLNSGFHYMYNNIDLSSLSTGVTLKLIYNKVFGPTYPGKFIGDYYMLSYPGICFKFHIGKLKGPKFEENLSYLLNLNHDIACEEILIFPHNSFDEFLSLLKQGNSMVQQGFKLKANIWLGLIELSLDDKRFTIKIGETSQQEVLNFLGPPDDTFNKLDSRLLIHNKLLKRMNVDHSSNRILKFHNYFKYGLDLLYDLTGNGVLNKVILYNGNVIELSNFSHWNKCNYEIYMGRGTNPFDERHRVDSSAGYFSDIRLEDKGTPVLLNRGESELINMDVIPINELNDWGQSKLYCFDHCIWEVLANDVVSCVTLY